MRSGADRKTPQKSRESVTTEPSESIGRPAAAVCYPPTRLRSVERVTSCTHGSRRESTYLKVSLDQRRE